MNKKCQNCKLVNFPNAENCVRCDADLIEVSFVSEKPKASLTFAKRASFCTAICILAVFGFYFSLIFSSEPLDAAEKEKVNEAVRILEAQGFHQEAILLEYLTSFRANDNWLNASIPKENAYAATNFPFEIMTLYEDFFEIPLDATERAAILLHEAQHLKGADERAAYEFVWKNRRKLGWTRENYGNSILWRNTRKQTKEYAPHLFVCELKEYGDCTE